MKIVSVVGTRPQLIKAAALQPALRARHHEVFVDTGQHWDAALAGDFFAELGLAKPDHSLGAGGGTHAEQTAAMLIGLEPILVQEQPDAVLVYGDTNSTLAGALAAAKLGIPVAHVEAGLRSFDRRMPEELNRVVADHLSTWLFAPTPSAVDHLANEGLTSGVVLVGDVMQDLAARVASDVRDPGVLAGIGDRLGATLEPGRYLFATVHRQENRDPAAMRAWAGILQAAAAPDRPVVLALHPGTRVAMQAAGVATGPDVVVVEPQGYRTSLALQLHAAAVVTDSGGVQREAAWLGVPCIVLRGVTEWTEALLAADGRMVAVGLDPVRAALELDRLVPGGAGGRQARDRASALHLEFGGCCRSNCLRARLGRRTRTMGRVVMYVQNDVTRDARVLREAGSLAKAGHEVTIVGVARDHGEPEGSREEREGFHIIRVSIPGLPMEWPQFISAPWRWLAAAPASIASSVRGGSSGWAGGAARIALAIAVIPWLVVRASWVAAARILGRPAAVPGLAYVRRWRGPVLGWDRLATAQAPVADVHHAHDFEALPAAAAAARRDGARLVYDSHEIFGGWGPILAQPGWLRWIMGAWETRLARRADSVVTVNDAIAADLMGRLRPRRVVVVYNCPPRWNPPPIAEDRIRRAAGIPEGAPVVLCHGGFQPGRGLEETADAMLEPGLETAHLVFLGYGTRALEPILGDPRLQDRVHYLPAVAPDEVTAWVAGADVDVMAILPIDRNKRLSTPNKLFESLAAGTPVVASDFPALREIVMGGQQGPLGAVCDPTDPAAIAAAIRSILELPADDLALLRKRTRLAAHERWNWETESAKLVALYDDLTATR